MSHQIDSQTFEQLNAFILVRHPPQEAGRADEIWETICQLQTGIPVYTHSTTATSTVSVRLHKSMRQIDCVNYEDKHGISSFFQDLSTEPSLDDVGYISLAKLNTLFAMNNAPKALICFTMRACPACLGVKPFLRTLSQMTETKLIYFDIEKNDFPSAFCVSRETPSLFFAANGHIAQVEGHTSTEWLPGLSLALQVKLQNLGDLSVEQDSIWTRYLERRTQFHHLIAPSHQVGPEESETQVFNEEVADLERLELATYVARLKEKLALTETALEILRGIDQAGANAQ